MPRDNPIEPIYTHIGRRLRRARLDAGLTIHAATPTGQPHSTLIMRELGRRRLAVHAFVQACRNVDLDPVEVLIAVLDEEPQP